MEEIKQYIPRALEERQSSKLFKKFMSNLSTPKPQGKGVAMKRRQPLNALQRVSPNPSSEIPFIRTRSKSDQASLFSDSEPELNCKSEQIDPGMTYVFYEETPSITYSPPEDSPSVEVSDLKSQLDKLQTDHSKALAEKSQLEEKLARKKEQLRNTKQSLCKAYEDISTLQSALRDANNHSVHEFRLLARENDELKHMLHDLTKKIDDDDCNTQESLLRKLECLRYDKTQLQKELDAIPDDPSTVFLVQRKEEIVKLIERNNEKIGLFTEKLSEIV